MMSLQIGKHPRKEEDRLTGLEVVAGNEDLLTLILLHLPVKSLLRFKSVSKHWLSLISNPQFCILKSKLCCKHISGLLLNCQQFYPDELFEFVSLDRDCSAPLERLDFVGSGTRLDLLQFCHGLVLIRTKPHSFSETEYYVINPTTRRHHAAVSFPVDKGLVVFSVSLAFDPRKSPYFKLICLFRASGSHDFCVQIYSSETGLITLVSDISHASSDFLSDRGIYWNGAINWIDYVRDGLYFNVDEERFGILPMPPVPQNGHGLFHRVIFYYGESNDQLFLVLTDTSPATQFDVYEMDREYSGWFVRFHVDLLPMFKSFPTESKDVRKVFVILAIVGKDGDQNPFIVFGRPGSAIRFQLHDRDFAKICDFSGVKYGRYPPIYGWTESIQFIESLHPL